MNTAVVRQLLRDRPLWRVRWRDRDWVASCWWMLPLDRVHHLLDDVRLLAGMEPPSDVLNYGTGHLARPLLVDGHPAYMAADDGRLLALLTLPVVGRSIVVGVDHRVVEVARGWWPDALMVAAGVPPQWLLWMVDGQMVAAAALTHLEWWITPGPGVGATVRPPDETMTSEQVRVC